MILHEELVRTGNWLFRRRGFLPLILFPLMVLGIWTSDPEQLMQSRSLLWKSACVFVILAGTLLRFWVVGQTPKGTSGRNTSGQVADSLNTEGPYSIVRHPLYVGNFLVMLGIVGWSAHEWLIAFFVVLYWLYYERIMMAEEAFLFSKYEGGMQKWTREVPAVIPVFSKYRRSKLAFSYKAVLRREYNGIMNTLFSLFIVDSLIQSRISDRFSLSCDLAWAVLAFLPVALGLKLIKKYSSLLRDSDRS